LARRCGTLHFSRASGRETLENQVVLRYATTMTIEISRMPAESPGLSDLACAGLDSVAIRVPAHPVARALIAALGRPVVAPSANRSGHVSPTSAAMSGYCSGRTP